MTETRLSRIAEHLLSVADRIRDADMLTAQHMQFADRLLWTAYEAGVFPDDDLFAFVVNEHYREMGSESGFAEVLLKKWLPVRVPALPRFDSDEKIPAEHGIRHVARMLLASVAKEAWEVGTPREFAKFVGMTDQQFRNWRNANRTCWERIDGSKKIRCSRTALDRLRNT